MQVCSLNILCVVGLRHMFQTINWRFTLILTKMRLRGAGMETEGLFRNEGSKQVQDQLKSHFQNGGILLNS